MRLLARQAAVGDLRVVDHHVVERNAHRIGGVASKMLVGKEDDFLALRERPLQDVEQRRVAGMYAGHAVHHHHRDAGQDGARLVDPRLAVEPQFANIRQDPRWLPFLESIGKSPAQLDAIKFKVTLPE
mgnify:CR=1 FL=1